MTQDRSARNRRALLFLAGAAAVYALISLLILPSYDVLRAAPDELTDKIGRLTKYRQELSHRGNYETLIAGAQKKIDEVQGHFFAGDAAGSAELQKMAEESAKSVGIDLMQRTVSGTRQMDDLVGEIGVALTFEATPNQLSSFLANLRAAPKMVKVKSAQIDPIQVAFEAPKAGEFKKTLRVSLSLAGMSLITAQNNKVK